MRPQSSRSATRRCEDTRNDAERHFETLGGGGVASADDDGE
jgi:hypothetical protein